MRLQYIFTYLRNRLPLVAVVACLWLASGCSDELNAPGGSDVPEGLPAVVTLKLDLGEMTPVSRADIPDDQANRVTSLWVAVYNVKTGARTGLYTSDDTENFTAGHQYKDITIEALSGESYIVAVANYKLRYATSGAGQTPVLLSEALAVADTWEKYCDIAVFFDEKGGSYVEVPANTLVMSGYFVAKDNAGHTGRPDMTKVTIRPDNYTPDGAVHLRRMISQVKFKINFDKNNISSCRVNSWRVSNLPSNAWLHERIAAEIADGTIKSAETDKPINSFDTRTVAGTAGYNNTDEFTTATADSDAFSYSFDFWMLENKRTGIIEPESGDDAKSIYRKREKEYKNLDGTNSGKYVSLVGDVDSDDLNNNATFVAFHVVMEMTVDEKGQKLPSGTRRIVETEYIVHLGYIGNDANDFNCFRNSKYTYNVTISNVDNVMVEARKEGEVNPAVEGFVSDITSNYLELDAHYCVFNIQLTRENIQNFRFYMEVPTMDGRTLYITQDNVPAENSDDYKYFKWVELRKANGENVIAEYKPLSNSGTYLLSDVKNFTQNGWYTVFINEYVYEDESKGGNEYGSENWKKYVNKPDRRVWLNVSNDFISDDNSSIYYKSKYAFSQKSIQCYYDINNGEYKSALGVEHRNETLGLALRNTFNPHLVHNNGNQNTSLGKNSVAGRYNLNQYLKDYKKSMKWSTYLNLTTLQDIPEFDKQGLKMEKRTEPLLKNKTGSSNLDEETNLKNLETYDPNSSEKIEAITACLSRNRDLDGDGTIDNGELRWFVPTSEQYVRLILGRQSLEDPLLDPAGLTQLEFKGENEKNSRFLFYASDGQTLWAMEGTSLGLYRKNGNTAAPWEVRCVRNLGSDMTQIINTAANTPAYTKRTVNGVKIIDMSGYDQASLRQEAFIDRPLPIHHINDQHHNRSYRAFEYKDEVISLSSSDFTDKNSKYYVKDDDSWSSYITRVNPCDRYNVNGEKGWRLPNQKELSILGAVDNIKKNSYQVSCTFSYFDSEGKVPAANETISSATRHEMKINSSNGGGTQYGFMKTGSDITKGIDGGTYSLGFRCVRDYTGSLK